MFACYFNEVFGRITELPFWKIKIIRLHSSLLFSIEIYGLPLFWLNQLLSCYIFLLTYRILQWWIKRHCLTRTLLPWQVLNRIIIFFIILLPIDMGKGCFRSYRTYSAHPHIHQCAGCLQWVSVYEWSVLYGWCTLWLFTRSICFYSKATIDTIAWYCSWG